MVPEIWSATDIIFCHFGSFFAFYPTNNPKSKFWKNENKPLEISSFYTSVPIIMIICYTVPETWHMMKVMLLFILGYFLLFYQPNNSPKNQNFKKMKKIPGDIIILPMCTKSYDQMMYGSKDMVCDRWMNRQTEGRQKK